MACVVKKGKMVTGLKQVKITLYFLFFFLLFWKHQEEACKKQFLRFGELQWFSQVKIKETKWTIFWKTHRIDWKKKKGNWIKIK